MLVAPRLVPDAAVIGSYVLHALGQRVRALLDVCLGFRRSLGALSRRIPGSLRALLGGLGIVPDILGCRLGILRTLGRRLRRLLRLYGLRLGRRRSSLGVLGSLGRGLGSCLACRCVAGALACIIGGSCGRGRCLLCRRGILSGEVGRIVGRCLGILRRQGSPRSLRRQRIRCALTVRRGSSRIFRRLLRGNRFIPGRLCRFLGSPRGLCIRPGLGSIAAALLALAAAAFSLAFAALAAACASSLAVSASSERVLALSAASNAPSRYPLVSVTNWFQRSSVGTGSLSVVSLWFVTL